MSSRPKLDRNKMNVNLIHTLSTPDEKQACPEDTRERFCEEIVEGGEKEYEIDTAGTADAINSLTRYNEGRVVVFEPNISLTIENTGEDTVVNPRLVTNKKRNWFTIDDMLEEILQDARTDQEKAYLIWDFIRQNRRHDQPLFTGEDRDELHDPVKMFNIYGCGLCDDAAHVGLNLYYRAGLTGPVGDKLPVLRGMHGHVAAEVFVDDDYQLMDSDVGPFYLDRRNARPSSGDAIARDHDLGKREHQYGPQFQGWRPAESAVSLLGDDDEKNACLSFGHCIDLSLRPGERIEYRWDNAGMWATDSRKGLSHIPPKHYTNSIIEYRPAVGQVFLEQYTHEFRNLSISGDGLQVIKPDGKEGYFVIAMNSPYVVSGASVSGSCYSENGNGNVSLHFSSDGADWTEVSAIAVTGHRDFSFDLNEALKPKQPPAEYSYFIKMVLESEDSDICITDIAVKTFVMTAPSSLPGLELGKNHIRYCDKSGDQSKVKITHCWEETHSLKAGPQIECISPANGQVVSRTTIPFEWSDAGKDAKYHIQVSRHEDMKIPYRPNYDLMVDKPVYEVPFSGMFNTDETYYWRVRARSSDGIWGPWSKVNSFSWSGPMPVDRPVYHIDNDGTTSLSWQPYLSGNRPVNYEIYGSDEKGFSARKHKEFVLGRGMQDANYISTTDKTEFTVYSPDMNDPAAPYAFYRVVPVDEHGVAGGPSDFVELPHPYICKMPTISVNANEPVLITVPVITSTGDLQDRRFEDKSPGIGFHEKEVLSFSLVSGPSWIKFCEATGAIFGFPPKTGNIEDRIELRVKDQFGKEHNQYLYLRVTSASPRNLI